MSGMKTQQARLGDYCSITSSKRIFESEYVSEGIPFFRSKEIIEKEAGKTDVGSICISQSRYHEIKEKFGVPQPGDVLLTSVGTLGIPYVVKESDLFYFKDGNLTWMRSFLPQMDSKYLYYWLRSSFGKQLLIQRAIGSSQAAITIDILKKYQLLLPQIIEQKKIVAILSAYDELIEKNNRKIAILQEHAQELYKEWFVRFRFPGHETAKFENGLPEGWKYCKLDSMIEFDPTIRSSYSDSYPIIPMEALSTSGFVIDKQLVTSSTSLSGSRSKNGDTLLARITPCLENGKTGYVDFLNDNEIAGGSTEFIVMRSKLSSSLFVYFIARDPSFRQEAINSMNGADGRQRAKSDRLKKIRWVLPSNGTIQMFDAQIQPIFNAVRKNIDQNAVLAQQRDLLLPRLMSGKLEIN